MCRLVLWTIGSLGSRVVYVCRTVEPVVLSGFDSWHEQRYSLRHDLETSFGAGPTSYSVEFCGLIVIKTTPGPLSQSYSHYTMEILIFLPLKRKHFESCLVLSQQWESKCHIHIRGEALEQASRVITLFLEISVLSVKVKVKITLEQAMQAQSSLTLALDEGGWSTPRPDRFTPGKETRYPLYRRLGGPQGRSGQVRKISPQPGFDPRTVQPVASRCTDWAIPTHAHF